MRASALALSVCLFGATAFAQTAAMRPTDITEEQVGKAIAVEGRVYSHGKAETGQIALYFGADISTAFRAIVPAGDVHKFKVDVVKKYTRRNVRVTGTVEAQDGKYYVVIREPKQIKVVPRKRRTSN